MCIACFGVLKEAEDQATSSALHLSLAHLEKNTQVRLMFLDL